MLCCAGWQLTAQTEVGGATLNGSVTDSSGAPITGAAVKITSAATGFTRSSATNDAGLYSFVSVPVGDYDLNVQQTGFRSEQLQHIRLDVGAVVTLDFRLEVGSTQQTLTINADAPVVETGRSQTSTIVNEKSVADLPVNGRNFIDFTTLTPGVVRDPTRGGDLSFGGQRGTANSLLVDGGEGNNLFFGQATGRTGFRPYAFSQDAVQEFQVNANSYPAEIGRAGGGVINVVTKSGTNQLHGSAFEFYRDKALNANTFTNNRARVRKQPYHFNQFGGSVGGPIRKDKVFFFLNYDGQRNTVPNVIVLTSTPPANVLPLIQQYLAPYSTGQDNKAFLAKVDFNLSDADRLSVRYNGNRFTGKNFENFGTTSAAEHTGNSEITTDNIAGNYTHVFGARAIYDARGIYLRDLEPGAANSAAPETILQQGGVTQIQFGRNNFSPRYTNVHAIQTVHTLSYIAGRHAFKAGADLDFQRIGNFFPGLFSGSYTFSSYANFLAGKPLRLQQNFPGPGTSGGLTHPNVNEYAFFAQDNWRVTDRLTLNYGLRWDLFRYAQPSVLNPNAVLQATGLRTNRVPLDNHDFAPRFGLAYKVFDHDSLVVRGGYGLFYARTPSILIGTAFSQNGIQVQSYTFTTGLPVYPAILSAPPVNLPQNIAVFDPTFRSPRTQQYSFNAEARIARDTSLTIGYLGDKSAHEARTRDINLYPEVATRGIFAGGAPATYLRHPGPASGPARPNKAFSRISLFESGASSRYGAAFVQLTKRYAQNFTLLASYTLANAKDTNPDATAVVVGTDDSKMAQDTLNPNDDFARANADVRHRFVFSGVWDIPFFRASSNRFARYLLGGYQFSSITQAQSGRPFTALAGGDPNNDGNRSSDRVPGVPRNNIKGPWFASVDARVSKDLPLYAERVRLRLIGEAFNVTNRANFNGIQNTEYNFASGVFTPRTDFLRRLSTFDPRILQLSAKIIF